jgi:hypothetical protein
MRTREEMLDISIPIIFIYSKSITLLYPYIIHFLKLLQSFLQRLDLDRQRLSAR